MGEHDEKRLCEKNGKFIVLSQADGIEYLKYLHKCQLCSFGGAVCTVKINRWTRIKNTLICQYSWSFQIFLIQTINVTLFSWLQSILRKSEKKSTSKKVVQPWIAFCASLYLVGPRISLDSWRLEEAVTFRRNCITHLWCTIQASTSSNINFKRFYKFWGGKESAGTNFPEANYF